MKVYPDDWRARLATAATTAVCMIVTLMLGPKVGIRGFWPGMLAVIVGIVFGGLLGRWLFPSSAGRPPNHPPSA